MVDDKREREREWGPFPNSLASDMWQLVVAVVGSLAKNPPRWVVWLWNAAVVIGALYLILTGKWWTLVIATLVGFILGTGAVAYERSGSCLPWAHEWHVTRVSIPLGEFKTCLRCGKVVAR